MLASSLNGVFVRPPSSSARINRLRRRSRFELPFGGQLGLVRVFVGGDDVCQGDDDDDGDHYYRHELERAPRLPVALARSADQVRLVA